MARRQLFTGSCSLNQTGNGVAEDLELDSNVDKTIVSESRLEKTATMDVSLNETVVISDDSDSPNKTPSLDISTNKTVELSDSSSLDKTVPPSLSDSPTKSVVSESMLTDQPTPSQKDEFTPSELWEIAGKTAAPPLECPASPTVLSISSEQIESVLETPSDSGWPGSLPIGKATPTDTTEILSNIKITGSDGTPTVEHISETPPSLFETPMEVEYMPQVTLETRQLCFNFVTSPPLQVTGAWTEFRKFSDNFLRGCKWAPDGLCIMTNSNDGRLRIFDLPDCFRAESWRTMNERPEMTSVLKIEDGDLVYDYCWYPLMNSMDASTSFLVSTSRYSPIHMFDAYEGKLLCSYRGFNQMDELESAYSLSFSCDGQKLLSGFDKTIRIFDVKTPGRECDTRKTKKGSQTGIISCIAVNPDGSGMFAAGSYLKTIGLYDTRDAAVCDVLSGTQGGVTHLLFSRDGTKLFSGGRKDSEILCWDLRNTVNTLCSMQREVTTNQRMYFDIESSGRYLASGSVNGDVYIWDTTEIPEDAEKEPVLQPKTSFIAQDDCVNGISFHPSWPILATASGQRKFAEPLHSEDSESDDDSSIFTDRYIVRDNSLQLWWCGDIDSS